MNLPDNVVRERLVPVYLPPDSALLTALFECDSNNRVIMKAFNELKSRDVSSNLTFDDGKLDYQAAVHPDTVYLPSKDSLIYVPKEVPVYVNRLTWWQEFWIRLGKFLAVAILLLVSPRLLKALLKLLKNCNVSKTG